MGVVAEDAMEVAVVEEVEGAVETAERVEEGGVGKEGRAGWS